MAGRRNASGRPTVISLVLATGIGAGGTLVALDHDAASFVKDKAAAIGLVPGCNIKGNISINSGERIYHVPGQMYYSQTRIRMEYGERWFCSEEEARAAGWRRARR